MRLALQFILLLLHFFLAGVGIYYLGDFLSQKVNILIIAAGGIVYSAVMISLIFHLYQFILSLKNQTKL